MLKLSRSAVELSLNCKRCFILQYKHRVSLRTLPFTLNSAVDNLCKNEFDFYRRKQQPHPIFIENNNIYKKINPIPCLFCQILLSQPKYLSISFF